MHYEKLYNAYYMQVYSYAITLTKNPEQAEEITQHTFVKAMSSKSKYGGKSSELTWLCAIAKNLYYDEIRRKQKLTKIEDVDNIPSSDDLEKAVSDADAVIRIHMVLHELEEPYKEVFQLRVFGELSFSQIGELFNKTDSWARLIFHRAKNQLRRCLYENKL